MLRCTPDPAGHRCDVMHRVAAIDLCTGVRPRPKGSEGHRGHAVHRPTEPVTARRGDRERRQVVVNSNGRRPVLDQDSSSGLARPVLVIARAAPT